MSRCDRVENSQLVKSTTVGVTNRPRDLDPQPALEVAVPQHQNVDFPCEERSHGVFPTKQAISKLPDIAENEEEDWVEVRKPRRQRRNSISTNDQFHSFFTCEEQNEQFEEYCKEYARHSNKSFGFKDQKKIEYLVRKKAWEKRKKEKETEKFKPHASEERCDYKCGKCGLESKNHICQFQITGTVRMDRKIRPKKLGVRKRFYKCSHCGDFKHTHVCVPQYRKRTDEEMKLLRRYFDLCADRPYRRKSLNSRIFVPGELEYEVENFPQKWNNSSSDFVPHGEEELKKELLGGDTHSTVMKQEVLMDMFRRKIDDDDEVDDNEIDYDAADEEMKNEGKTIAESKTSSKKSEQEPLDYLLGSFVEVFKSEENEHSSPELSNWMSQMEKIIILGYQLGRADTFTDVVFAILAYIKMNSQESMLQVVLQYVDTIYKDVKSDKMKPHAAEESFYPQAWDGEDMKRSWNLLKTNTIFSKISHLISVAMSMSVCSIKQITWSPFGFDLVKFEALQQQVHAVDFIDSCVAVFAWFVDVGSTVMKEKSLYPILFSNAKMREFNDKCDFVFAHADQISAGNYEGSLEEYEAKVDECLDAVQKMRNTKPDAPTATWLQDRINKLMTIKNKIVSCHKSSTLRFFPFCVAVTGDSGIGKTAISKMIMKCCLHAMGFNSDTKFQRTRNWKQKHDNEIVSSTLGLFYDDVGAQKAQFAEQPEAAAFIHENNGVPLCADKAEIEAKGVTFFQHKVSVATSNFRNLNFHHYSDYPAAALNRLIYVRAEVKPEYRKRGGVSLDTGHPDLQDGDFDKDVWNLSLEQLIVYESPIGARYRFETFEYKFDDGRTFDTSSLSLDQLLKILVDMAKKHKKRQDKMMDGSNSFDNQPLCANCSMFKRACECESFNMKPHAAEIGALTDVVSGAVEKGVRAYINSFFRPLGVWNSIVGLSPVKYMTTQQLAKEVRVIADETVTPLVFSLLPSWLYETTTFQRCVASWQRSAALYDIRRHALLSCAGSLLTGCVVKHKTNSFGQALSATAFLGACSAGFCSIAYSARLKVVRDEYVRRRDALPEYAKSVRDSDVMKAGFAVSTLLVAIKFLRMWNRARLGIFKPQTDEDEDEEEDEEGNEPQTKDHPGWFGFMMEKLGLKVGSSDVTRHIVPKDMIRAFERNNLFLAKFCRADGSKISCNIFFPRKGVAIFPKHVFHKDGNLTAPRPSEIIDVHVDRKNGKPGAKFSFSVDNSNCVRHPTADLMVAHVPNCPDLKTRLDWLPTSLPTGSCLATFLVHTKNGPKQERISVDCGPVGHMYCPDMYGGKYDTDNAQVGSCMGVVIAETKRPVLLGFHIGGNSEEKRGCMVTLTRHMADDMIRQLGSLPSVCLSSEAVDLPKTQYGVPLVDSRTIHPHAMASKLGEDDFVDVLGSTKLRMKQKSRVQKSILSRHVEDVCEVPNIWGPPKLEPNWKGYNATLQHVVSPAQMFTPSLLWYCVQDWLTPLVVKAKDSGMKPLTDKEMIMGVPGQRFLEPLKMSTSVGSPLYGKKEAHFEETREGEKLVDRRPKEHIQREYERCIDCWDRGVRAYPISASTLKDEPTKQDSEKVRVFQAAAVAMSMAMRKFFLPIAKFLGDNPVDAECAVGVNCFSPEWDKLMTHVEGFAQDGQVVAWDYSKYDVRMNSQVTTAVWNAFILLAKQSGGYSERDLRIMENMVNDIVHPLLDWNGTLLMAYNMNTSGNNLTVNVNSTAGSLYVRVGFFSVYPELIGKKEFRECVKAMTYGDDFKGSVHPDFRKFNFSSYQSILAQHDIKITPPDKSEESFLFMETDDADFLKRNSNFIPEIGTRIGALDEKSIFKSLHSNLKSKEASDLEVAASCVECAMHEWFAHGREVYELRQKQMEEVCKRACLPVPAVAISFDNRVIHWKEKYKNDKQN